MRTTLDQHPHLILIVDSFSLTHPLYIWDPQTYSPLSILSPYSHLTSTPHIILCKLFILNPSPPIITFFILVHLLVTSSKKTSPSNAAQDFISCHFTLFTIYTCHSVFLYHFHIHRHRPLLHLSFFIPSHFHFLITTLIPTGNFQSNKVWFSQFCSLLMFILFHCLIQQCQLYFISSTLTLFHHSLTDCSFPPQVAFTLMSIMIDTYPFHA